MSINNKQLERQNTRFNYLPRLLKNAPTLKVLGTCLESSLAPQVFYTVDKFLAFYWEITQWADITWRVDQGIRLAY